ncbi:hypothetical protein [Kitasatospora sp. NPDC001527]|uniref:hypothetical protein n=1 Tax=Kitasatospora sp. NPDC001527 TaxID=3154519 RepID=UPI00331B3D6D
MRRDLWALLRRCFPGASSGACAVAANELRAAISAALTADTRRPIEPHDRQWTVESVLTTVVAGLLTERNLRAGAVADVSALHEVEDGIFPACRVLSPCPTLRAVTGSGDHPPTAQRP